MHYFMTVPVSDHAHSESPTRDAAGSVSTGKMRHAFDSMTSTL
jgi:hypothetical protein